MSSTAASTLGNSAGRVLRDVGTFDDFAQRAHVVTEYPASTLLIDDYLGLEIQFDSLDNELDEYPFTEAQQK